MESCYCFFYLNINIKNIALQIFYCIKSTRILQGSFMRINKTIDKKCGTLIYIFINKNNYILGALNGFFLH